MFIVLPTVRGVTAPTRVGGTQKKGGDAQPQATAHGMRGGWSGQYARTGVRIYCQQKLQLLGLLGSPTTQIVVSGTDVPHPMAERECCGAPTKGV